MEISDAELLRELRRAIDAAAPAGNDAQARAVEETLRRYQATMADVARALGALRERRRRELSGLAGRIDALAERRQEDFDTADAVDRFVRALRGDTSR
jgi:hypothetical protein